MTNDCMNSFKNDMLVALTLFNGHRDLCENIHSIEISEPLISDSDWFNITLKAKFNSYLHTSNIEVYCLKLRKDLKIPTLAI